jgi:antitoxin (DNA-binding transcriptional repressor) of toxin-antitoxin stability system
MTTITLEKARNELPDLLERALAGEEIVITTDDKAVRLALLQFDEATARKRGWGSYAAQSEAVAAASSYRGRGSMKGQLVVGPVFFEPLPEDELKYWEGRGDE